MGKPCGIGPVGFPLTDTCRRRTGGSPLDPKLSCRHDQGWITLYIHTIIPIMSVCYSLGAFLTARSVSYPFLQCRFHRTIMLFQRALLKKHVIP